MQIIKQESSKRGWKQKDLQKNAKLSQSTVSRLWNGVGVPTEDTYTKLSKTFGIPIEELRGYINFGNNSGISPTLEKRAILPEISFATLSEDKVNVVVISQIYGITNLSQGLLLDRVLKLHRAKNPQSSP